MQLSNEALLQALRDKVAQPGDLGLGLIGDGSDVAVVLEDAPGPARRSPLVLQRIRRVLNLYDTGA